MSFFIIKSTKWNFAGSISVTVNFYFSLTGAVSINCTYFSVIFSGDARVSGARGIDYFVASPPLPFFLIPLEIGPLNPARGLGSAVSFPSRVWC